MPELGGPAARESAEHPHRRPGRTCHRTSAGRRSALYRILKSQCPGIDVYYVKPLQSELLRICTDEHQHGSHWAENHGCNMAQHGCARKASVRAGSSRRKGGQVRKFPFFRFGIHDKVFQYYNWKGTVISTLPTQGSTVMARLRRRRRPGGHTTTVGSGGRHAPFSTDTASHTHTARSLACPLLTLSSARPFSNGIFRSKGAPAYLPPASSSLTHARRMDR